MCRILLSFVFALLVVVSGNAFAAPGKYRGMTVPTTVSAQDLRDLRALGANLIRYPLVCGDICDTFNREQYEAWLESALVNFETVILPATQEVGLNVILSLNATPGGYLQRGAKPMLRVFTDSWAQEAYISLWPKISQRFLNTSNIIAYDILSEPAQLLKPSPGLLDWNGLAAVTAQAVRSIDSSKRIIIEPIVGAPERLKNLKLPKIDTVTIGFNMYFPLQFTHQGLDDFKNTFLTYPSKKVMKKKVLAQLGKVAIFLRRHKGVPVHVGEFTVTRWTGDSGNRYLNDIINYFERKGWTWTYHAWREADPWDVERVPVRNSLERSPTPTERQILLQKFFGKNR